MKPAFFIVLNEPVLVAGFLFGDAKMKSPTQQGAVVRRLLRRRQVEQALGLSKSTIYARMDKNSSQYDPAMPRSIKIGVTSIAFIEAEINAYIDHLIATSRGAA